MIEPRSAKRVAAVYVAVAALQRGVSFLILPFVARAMAPAEYGAASILTVTALLLVAVFAPVELLLFRSTARGDDDGPELVRAVGIYCYVIIPIVGGIAAAGVGLTIPHTPVLGITGTIWAIELLAIGFLPAATSFALPLVRARQDLRRFTFLALASVIFTATAKLVLVVTLQLGVLGWAISDFATALMSALLAWIVVRIPRGEVTARGIRAVLSFCIPLVPHRASFWALTSLSRPALAMVSTLAQVGLFSFGANIAVVAYLILTEVNQAVQPNYARETFPAPTRETLNISQWQIIFALAVPSLIGAGLALIGPIIFPPPYWSSFPVAGVLMCGQSAIGIYAILMNYVVLTARQPRLAMISSLSGTVITTVGIFVLGPTLGALGVGFATSAGFGMMVVVLVGMTRILHLEITWKAWQASWLGGATALLSLACIVVALFNAPGSAVAVGLASAGSLLALAALIIRGRQDQAAKL